MKITREEIKQGLIGILKISAEEIAALDEPPPFVSANIAPEQIKELRTNRCMTQVEFAKFFKVTVDTVRKWEAGKRVPSPLAQQVMDWMKEGKV